jgi:flagellar basal-body rod protein FlgF
MDRSLYVAMSGAKQIEYQQITNTHNLANASTTGFRADFDTFNSLPVYGPGNPTRVYSQDNRTGINFEAGTVAQTGRDLDISVNGTGFIAIQSPEGGEAYTRAGDLRVTTGGLLQTGKGEPVMGNAGPIALPPYSKLEIGADGTLSIIPIGDGATELATIDRIKLVNPSVDQLEKGMDGLIRSVDGQPIEADAFVQISSGTLESSNVNAVSELLNMIDLARRFEMHVKLMETVRDVDQSSATILRQPN